MGMPSPYVAVSNPYRSGSQLAEIWGIIQDGSLYPLGHLEYRMFGLLDCRATGLRKRRRRCIASALRTIRKQPNRVDIIYNKASKTYQMVEVL